MILRLTDRLRRRFSGLSDEELTAAIFDGIATLGYGGVESVPTVDFNLLLALVSYEIATDQAAQAATYFSYTDGTESIDKTKIMENFASLAENFKAEYENELAKREAATVQPLPIFHIMKRADRT